jgi:3-oxoadipate enol-lactonase
VDNSEAAGRGRVDGADGVLHFSRTGSGHPLILLHPLALSGAMWGAFAARLATRFDVIALDVRGHGRSGWSGAPFTVEDLGDDVLSLVDGLDLPAAHVIGMSMGGSVALAFASAHPERVSGLFLADTTAWYGVGAPETWDQRAERVVAEPRAAQVPFQVDRWFTEPFRREHPEAVQPVVRVFLGTDSVAHAAACRALGAMDLRRKLGQITAPTVVVTGVEDYATPPEMGATIAEGVAGARAEVLDGLRHLSLIERPDLADAAADHLSLTEVAP